MAEIGLPFPWIDGLTRRQQKEIYDDFMAVARAVKHSGHRPYTLVVAPSNASVAGRAAADYVCNGSNDFAILQAAITELAQAGGGGGEIKILEGTINVGANVVIVDTSHANITISGNGRYDTTVAGSHASQTFKITGAGTAEFYNMAVSNSSGTGAAVQANTGRAWVHDCYLTGFRGFYQDGGIGSQTNLVHDNVVVVSGSGCRGIQFVNASGESCFNNLIQIANAGRGISIAPGGAGYNNDAIIAGNHIFQAVQDTGAVGIYVGWFFFDETNTVMVSGNRVYNVGIGILLAGGDRPMVSGNQVSYCTIGIDTDFGNTALTQASIIGNYVSATVGSTAHIRLQKPISGNDATTVAFNRCSGTTPANAIVVAAGVTNAGVFFNETYGGYGSAAVSDAGTNTRREIDMLGSTVTVRLLPSGGATGTVLVKQSAADYDVAWATDPAFAAATAKGDMLAALAAGSIGSLHVDRDGQILMTDSTQALGVKWGPKVTISPTQPASPRAGDIWIDTT